MIDTMDRKFINQKETEVGFFGMRDDGIFFSKAPKGAVMDLEDAIHCTEITHELQNGIPHPLICDISDIVKMTKECRAHFSGDIHAKTYTACALIISNPISKIIGNFFIGLNKPNKKVKLFTDEAMAVEWLKENG